MLVFNSFGNKQISNKIREQCKRFKIRLTRKVNGKRIYKTIKQLKTQLATAKNNRNKFGAKNASASKPRIESATKTVTNYVNGCHVTQGGSYGSLHSTCPNEPDSRVAHYTEENGIRFWTTDPPRGIIPKSVRRKLVDTYNYHINIANERENRNPGDRGRGPPSSGAKRKLFSNKFK
jgi:hypothetical protein